MTQTDKHDDKQDKPEPRLQRAKTWVVERPAETAIVCTIFVIVLTAYPLRNFWVHDATRNVAFVIGGLIAIYGVVIAARRQATNHGQYELALKSDFSESLAKGVNAIPSDSVTIKTSGIRVFENLAKSIEADSDNYGMIVKTIHDFITENAERPIDEDTLELVDVMSMEEWPKAEVREQRQHIEVGIEVLAELISKKNNRTAMRLQLLDLRGLGFQGINMKGASLIAIHFGQAFLRNAYLTDVSFTFCSLKGASLVNTKLGGAGMFGSNLTGANLGEADLNGAKFNHVELFSKLSDNDLIEKLDVANVDFLRHQLDHADFTGANVTDADFSGTKAIEGAFNDEQLASMKKQPDVLIRQQVLELFENEHQDD